MAKNRFMGDDDEARALVVERKSTPDEPGEVVEEDEPAEEEDAEQAESDFLEWSKEMDAQDASPRTDGKPVRMLVQAYLRSYGVRTDGSDRQLYLRAIAASGVNVSHPLDGVDWASRSDVYLREFALGRMDGLKVEVEEDDEGEASEDMSDRMGEEEGHDSEQRFLDWSDEQDREDASCRKDAGDDYERDEDGKFAGSGGGGGGGGYIGPRGGKRGGNDASNTASPHGKAAREHAKAAVEHARQVRAHAEKHPTDANKAAAASADKNSKNARASARKAEAESDPAKAAAHAAKAESHAKANQGHAEKVKAESAAPAAKPADPNASSKAAQSASSAAKAKEAIRAGKEAEAHALATKAIEAKQEPSIPGIPAAGYGSVAGTPLTKSQASELTKYPMGKPKKK